MDDYLIKDYREQEKKYRDDAFKAASGYLRNRTNNIDLNKVQSILYALLRSYQYKIRLARRREELSLKNIKVDFIKKASLEKRVQEYDSRIEALDNVLQLDFASNPYVLGKLSYGYCEEFSIEDASIYTLFNEVRNYYEKNTKPDDVDRMGILDKITKLKALLTNARHDIVSTEQELVQKAFQVIEKELKKHNDLTNRDLFAVYDDFKHGVKKHKYNSDYISELYVNHYPKYEDKNKDLSDGFGEDAKSKTSGLLDYKMMLIGRDRVQALITSKDFNTNQIYDLLQRKQEVEEILSLLERIVYVLEERNHTPVNCDSHVNLNYDRVIIFAQDFMKYCEVLIDKYYNELKELKYLELEERIERAVESSKNQPLSQDNTYSLVEEEKEETNELEVKSDNNDVTDMNSKMIYDLGITYDLLQLAIDDLCLFGFLDTDKYEELKPDQITSVISHCLKLREISSLSDEDKTVVRATWPRVENGKVVFKESPTSGDVLVQRNLDERRAIINRINTFAHVDEMDL